MQGELNMSELVDKAYAAHQDLLKRAESSSDAPKLVADVNALIEQMC